jgi:MtN3 and saliva related transmembrane protein
MNLIVFGYFAAFFTAVSFLPQAIKTVRTRETAGLSLLTYLFLFLGSLSWFIYGLYLTDYPLMVTNSLTTVFTGIILYLIFSERNNKI